MIGRRRLCASMLASLGACTAADRAASLRAPDNLGDLLRNLREVTASGALIDDAFYTEDRLKRVFGGTIAAVERSRQYGFEGIVTGATVGGFPPWAGAGRLRIRGMSGLSYAELWMDTDGSTFSFADMERVLGTGWAPFHDFSPHAVGPPQRPAATDEHGYATVWFALAGTNGHRGLILGFDRAGKLRGVTAECASGSATSR